MHIRWGILGTARIAREAVIPAMQSEPATQTAQLLAIASRDVDRAQQVAQQQQIPRAYGSYEELLADGEIDAIYVPLPNHLHLRWTQKALEAGKHVLCEKPLALSTSEVQTLRDIAADHAHLKVGEAFMYRHHPQWEWVTSAVAAGRIGTLRAVHSLFTFFDDDPDSILHQPAAGGGALWDIGCYSTSLSRLLFSAEPLRVIGWQEIDARFRVDDITAAILQFPTGTATFTCATCTEEHQRVTILGTRGLIEIAVPFNPSPQAGCQVKLVNDGTVEEIHFPACDQYAIQIHDFSQAILRDTPARTSLDEALANLRVMETIVASREQGTWLTL